MKNHFKHFALVCLAAFGGLTATETPQKKALTSFNNATNRTDIIKKCTICDFKGNRRLFYKATSSTDENPAAAPFNFTFNNSISTNTENLHELLNWSENLCVHCGKAENLGIITKSNTGKHLLEEIYKHLNAKLTDTTATSTSQLEKTASALAEKLYARFADSQQKLAFLYGKTVNHKKVRESFVNKYKAAREDLKDEVKNPKIRQMIFDDLCAAGFLYQNSSFRRPSNLKELCTSFEAKQFCDECLKNMIASDLPKIWNITRPIPLGAAHFGGAGKTLLSALKMLTLSDISVDEYAGGAHSPFLEIWTSKAKPARKIELDTRWADYYKSRKPDLDPALEHGYLKENALGEQKSFMGNTIGSLIDPILSPGKTISNNFFPVVLGFLTTYLNINAFNPEQPTKNLSEHIVDNLFTWGGAADATVMLSNLLPLNSNLGQARENRNYFGDLTYHASNFALGRVASPMLWAKTLGADPMKLMMSNIGVSLLAPQLSGTQNSKSGMLIGQSLGLLARGHMIPAATSFFIPFLLHQYI